VADVIQAVDGPLTVTACSDDDQDCEQYSKCSIRDPLWKIRGRIVEALTAVSVADLNDEPVTQQSTVSPMNFLAKH
jgi:DNA-binding IscR family transcriptional regulator